MKPKSITVVIPVYNAEKTIVSVLDAICKQTVPELIKEIIVVNDGSKDNSITIISDYIEKASCTIRLVNKANGGVSSARNTGMMLAETEWIALCDADDIWKADKLERQAAAIDKIDIDLIGGNHTNRPIRIMFHKIEKIHRGSIKELCIKTFPQTSTILMRKKIFDEIGGFDESRSYAEDGQYLMKIAAKYAYYCLPDQLVEYGGGKRGFGVSGLSANLEKMQEGVVKNLIEVRKARLISYPFYCWIRLFNLLKYIRRILITRFIK